MSEVKTYHLKPTRLIPNSHFPLLHYPAVLKNKNPPDAVEVHRLFKSNGWQTQWIFRYGPTQSAHYHSQTHECMAVLTGNATIRFGVADTEGDLEASTHGDAQEDGGIEVKANAGDVFIIPAGVSHKTYDPSDGSTFKLLTPGDGHGVDGDAEKVLDGIELSGFTMIGAYPRGGQWDFAVGGEDNGEYEKVWHVPKPEHDPVFGDAHEGLAGLW